MKPGTLSKCDTRPVSVPGNTNYELSLYHERLGDIQGRWNRRTKVSIFFTVGNKKRPVFPSPRFNMHGKVSEKKVSEKRAALFGKVRTKGRRHSVRKQARRKVKDTLS